MTGWFESHDEEAAFRKWQQKEHEKNIQSYPEGAEYRYCWRCGELLRYNSMAYEEGWHFDTCE